MHAHLTSHRGLEEKFSSGEPMSEKGHGHEFESCEEIHGAHGKDDVAGNIIFEGLVRVVVRICLQKAIRGHRKNQNHQQAHLDWIKRSYKAGLRVVVSHAVNNIFACELTGGSAEECDDMLTVEDQLNYLKKMEEKVANEDDGWFKLVYSSKEARKVIAEGKLAVVMELRLILFLIVR